MQDQNIRFVLTSTSDSDADDRIFQKKLSPGVLSHLYIKDNFLVFDGVPPLSFLQRHILRGLWELAKTIEFRIPLSKIENINTEYREVYDILNNKSIVQFIGFFVKGEDDKKDVYLFFTSLPYFWLFLSYLSRYIDFDKTFKPCNVTSEIIKKISFEKKIFENYPKNKSIFAYAFFDAFDIFDKFEKPEEFLIGNPGQKYDEKIIIYDRLSTTYKNVTSSYIGKEIAFQYLKNTNPVKRFIAIDCYTKLCNSSDFDNLAKLYYEDDDFFVKKHIINKLVNIPKINHNIEAKKFLNDIIQTSNRPLIMTYFKNAAKKSLDIISNMKDV